MGVGLTCCLSYFFIFKMNQADLFELRSYRKNPRVLRDVSIAMSILLGSDEDELKVCKTSKILTSHLTWISPFQVDTAMKYLFEHDFTVMQSLNVPLSHL